MSLKLSLLAALLLSLSAVACATPGVEDGDPAVESEVTTDSVAFEAFQAEDGGFRFHVLAGNGALLLTSKSHATAVDAEASVEVVVTHGNDPRWFEVVAAEGSGFVIHMKTPEGEILASSDTYASRASADRGASTVRALIRGAQQARMAAKQQPAKP